MSITCNAPTIIVGGVALSTSTYENNKQLIDIIGSDVDDPTADEREGYIALGNNTKGTTGIQVGETMPTQTTLPPVITAPPVKDDVKPPPGIAGATIGCPVWDGINYDHQLSQNFKLRVFTIGGGTYQSANITGGPLSQTQLIDVNGISKQVRFCNLMNLSQNICEPLYARFGAFRINSGLRNQNTLAPPKMSQHVSGQAIDVQFVNWSYDHYWEMAPWIRDNIPYDQFIFEHSSKSKTAWLHLSFSQSGSRSVSDPFKVCTMYKGHYSPGLKKFY